jgi:histone deacetylase complex regulatory component SIN3
LPACLHQAQHSSLPAALQSPLQPAPADTGKKALQETDALSFLSEVRSRFSHRPHVYTEFLNIMRGFKVRRNC